MTIREAADLIDPLLEGERELARFGAALFSRVGLSFQESHSRWAEKLLGKGEATRLPDLFRECGVLSGEPPVIQADELSRLLRRLSVQESETPVHEECGLVWTIPSSLSLDGRSYHDALSEVIRSAIHRVILVAPYLEREGIGMLEGKLLGAVARGVKIDILAHHTEDLGSLSSLALEELRRSVEETQGGRLSVYSANTESFLLHSKIAVADETLGVVGSANLTGNALEKNFELGVEIGSRNVKVLTSKIDHLLSSRLSQIVYTVPSEED